MDERPTLDGFFNQSLDLLFIADTDGRLQRINPAFCEILCYAEDDLLSKRLTELGEGTTF